MSTVLITGCNYGIGLEFAHQLTNDKTEPIGQPEVSIDCHPLQYQI